jgi:transposase-like protein
MTKRRKRHAFTPEFNADAVKLVLKTKVAALAA